MARRRAASRRPLSHLRLTEGYAVGSADAFAVRGTSMKLGLVGDEQLLASAGANLVIRPADYDLGRFAADQLLWAVGMAGKESIGGKAYVTDCRIAFVAHRFNRLRGTLSIPITELDEVRPYWRGVKVGLVVKAGDVQHDLITWSRGRLVTAAQQAHSHPGGTNLHSDGLQVNKVAQVINAAARGAAAADDTSEKLDLLSRAWARRLSERG